MSFLLFATAVALRSAAGAASTLQLDTSVDLAVNPLSKVEKLLKDMQATLEKDAKADEELYEKLSCWCTTNDREKSAAVKTAGERITSLTAEIEEHTAKSAQLKAGMGSLLKDIAKSEASIQQATNLRDKEHAEFSSDEKDLVDSLRSVSAAVDTLSKHNSFLQVDNAARAAVAKALEHAAHAVNLLPEQRKVLTGFIQGKQMPSAGSYSSRSGPIFGILEQMKETFESNLSQSQKEEMQSQREFDALVAAKTREINAAKAGNADKIRELAETDEAKVHAKHDLQKTREALTADQAFLVDLQERCSNADAEYAQRTKARNLEISGVSDALTILNDDANRDLFSSTFSFVQVQSAPERAAAVLRKAGIQAKSSALVALSSTVELDSFTKVKAAIDEMVTALKTEQKDEVVHQRFCEKELSANQKGQDEANKNVKDLEVNLADMAATVDTLKTEIAALENEVAETNTAIKRASEDREAENQEFQQTVADQRATQMVLAKVLARLREVYKTALVQKSKQEPGAAAPPMPKGFDEYKQQGSGGVLSLIEKIASEANDLEKEALHAEQESQKAYERFVKDGANSVNAANRALSAKRSQSAELETATVAAEGDKKANLGQLEHLMSMAGKLHMSCDFVLNNFEARQTARQEEIDALGDAKAILSGADFD